MKRKFKRKKRLCRKRLRDSWRNRQKKMRCIDREKEKERSISRDKDIELERKGKRIKEKLLFFANMYIAIFCILFHTKLSLKQKVKFFRMDLI